MTIGWKIYVKLLILNIHFSLNAILRSSNEEEEEVDEAHNTLRKNNK